MLLCLLLLEDPQKQNILEQLYLENRQEWFYKAWRILQDADLAEESIQMAFERILTIEEKFFAIPCHKRAGFIGMVVKGKALDLWRKRKREREHKVDFDYVEETLAAPQRDLDLKITLEKALGALPEQYQRALRLRYAYDCSYEDMALILEESEATLRQRVHRGKAMLQNILNPEGGKCCE